MPFLPRRFLTRGRRSFGAGLATLVVAGLGCVVVAPAAWASTWVDCAAGGDLQSAIDAAPSGSTIDVTGTCIGNFTISGVDLSLVGPATLGGGGSGTVLTVQSSADVELEAITVQDGLSTGNGGGISNAGTLMLQSSTVTDNQAANGGGIYNNVNAQLALDGSVVSANTATENGGGIWEGSVTLYGSTVEGNTAQDGGGIYGGDLSLDGASVSDNTATAGYNDGETVGGWGGGLYFSGGTITGSTIDDNTALDGGGLYYFDGPITDSTISGNVADAEFSQGGGIFGTGLDIISSSITDNSAGGDGGGIAGAGTILNSVISHNEGESGGGVWLLWQYPGPTNSFVITGSTISDNEATWGGGIATVDGEFPGGSGDVTLDKSTLYSNTASTIGGAIYTGTGSIQALDDTFAYDDGGANTGPGYAFASAWSTTGITIAGSILQSAACSQAVTDGGYNVESDNSCDLLTTGSAPSEVNSATIGLATTLASNGSNGPETLAISPGSSAYEEVPASACTLASDERGEPRPGVEGQACDAGAFEFQQPAITSASSTTFSLRTSNSFTVATSGDGPVRLRESGPLPSGVAFVVNGDGTATFSGTPATGSGGDYPVSVTANNGAVPNAVQGFTLVVEAAPVEGAPRITSPSTASLAEGDQVNLTVTASGSPLPSLSESGDLPPGLSFTANDNGAATVSGVPTAVGTYSVVVSASNNVGSVTQTIVLVIGQGPAVTSPATATTVVGKPFSFRVTTTGYPVPTLSGTGKLPPGLEVLSAGDGNALITGTPTTTGTYSGVITASNGVSPKASQALVITVTS